MKLQQYFSLVQSEMLAVFAGRIVKFLAIAILLLMAVLCLAVVVAIGSNVVMAGFVLLALTVCIFALMFLGQYKMHNQLFWFGMIIYFAIPIFYLVTGVYGISFIQVYFSVFGVLGLPALWRVICQNSWLAISFSLLLIYFVFAVFSAAMPVNYQQSFVAVAFQFVMDLKPYLILGFGFYVVGLYGSSVWKIIERLGAWLLLPMLLSVLIQYLFPGIFKSIFAFAQSKAEFDGFFPSRAVGLFEQSAFLAAFSAFYALYYFVVGLCSGQCPKIKCLAFLCSAGYVGLLLCAIQRQELVALFGSMLLAYMLHKKENLMLRVALSGIVLFVGFVSFMAVFGDETFKEMDTWGGNPYAAITHPRANLYDGAFSIAKEYFPLGSGLGSYAGSGSLKFNQDLFYKMGFGNLWWFGKDKESYLMDSYWAHPIAESGFIGAGCLFAHYACLLWAILLRIRSKNLSCSAHWLVAGGSLLYLILTSPTSPSFIDPRIILFPFLAIAIAYRTDIVEAA